MSNPTVESVSPITQAVKQAGNKANTIVLGEFGTGPWKQYKTELYSSAQHFFGFSKLTSHALAEQSAMDAGRSAQVKGVKWGTVDKNGGRSMKPVMAAIKTEKTTPAVDICVIMVSLTQAKKDGLVVEPGSLTLDKAHLEAVEEYADRLQCSAIKNGQTFVESE
jgi:hypothetical protein